MLAVYQIIAFLLAISVHESAHGWMANRLGDPTAKLEKRISLNPLRHLDPVGSILVPLFLILVGSPFVFGWAKPVIFDPFNLKNPRKDTALISLAGPAANFLTAIVLSLLIRILEGPFSQLNFILPLLYLIVIINLVLGVFNLIPIHPLDGGKILVGILPQKEALEADQFLNRYGFLILLALIFLSVRGVSPLSAFLEPVINFLTNLLLPSSRII